MENLLLSELQIKSIIEELGYMYKCIYRTSNKHPYRAMFHIKKYADGTSISAIVQNKTKTQLVNSVVNSVKRYENARYKVLKIKRNKIEIKDSSRYYIEEVK